MKKILLLITTMLIAGGVQAQSYDKLKSMLFDRSITYDTCRITNHITYDELKVYIDQTTEYGNWKKAKTGNPLWDLNNSMVQFEARHAQKQQITIPKVIYNEYMLGSRLYKAGATTIIIAAPITVIGAICFCNKEPKNQLAGSILLATGSSILSCSIPLLCAGDHLKRTANKDYILQTYF